MRRLSAKQIDEALALLEQGGVLIFPTETSYGLGCDATNEEAVARVFAIKGRPDDKALPILLPSLQDAWTYVELNDKAKDLAGAHWPGALNIIAPATATSPVSERCAHEGTQAVRVSSHEVASTLARRLDKPLVATSANLAGQPSLYSVENVEDIFANTEAPDAVLDVGALPETPASTTIRIDGDEIEVLRQGSIKLCPAENV